jgi:hypothetical protein
MYAQCMYMYCVCARHAQYMYSVGAMYMYMSCKALCVVNNKLANKCTCLLKVTATRSGGFSSFLVEPI